MVSGVPVLWIERCARLPPSRQGRQTCPHRSELRPASVAHL